jgi:hypothetical protein
MVYINEILIKKINNKYRDSLGYYPDILFYQHNKEQYENALRLLAKARYIYTDGYSFKPVGLFTYLFQSFKGLLGLTNYCEAPKVQMALQKFAFYGYLKGYPQDELVNLESHGLPQDYRKLVSGKIDSQTSARIQEQLITFYLENQQSFSKDIKENQPLISSNSVFGNTLAQAIFWTNKKNKVETPSEEIPKLDPQDDLLISSTINILEGEKQNLNKPDEEQYPFLHQSKYAFYAAKHNIFKAKNEQESFSYNIPFSGSRAKANLFLGRALYFNDKIYLEEKHIYINYFIMNNQKEKALRLIEQLDTTQSAQALKYVIDNDFSDDQLTSWVRQDSKLAYILTNYFLLKRDNTPGLIKFIASFHTPTKLSSLYPVQAFIQMVENKKYDEAYTIFSQAKSNGIGASLLTKASAQARTLANHFANCGKISYTQGTESKEKGEWTNATKNYEKNLEAHKIALELEPESEARKENHFKAKRLYAELLIEDDVTNRSIIDCYWPQICKAIQQLQACTTEKSEEIEARRAAIIRGRIRQVDYCINKILTPLIYFYDETQRNNYFAKNEDNFNNLVSALQHIIKMLKDTKDSQLKPILGKAYFLLGDVGEFFKIDLNNNAQDYFKRAKDTVPNNPCYALRYAEFLDSSDAKKLQNKFLDDLRSLGFTQEDWDQWKNDHWYKDKQATLKITDIHSVRVVPKVEKTLVENLMNNISAALH